MRQRAAMIILHDDKVALIKRVRGRTEYFLFPGGTVESGETVEQAAIREAFEELGVHIALGRLVAVVERNGGLQYHFLATIAGGEFGTGQGAELGHSPESETGSYSACWLPVSDLVRCDVRPRQLAKAIHDGALATLESPITLID